MIWALVQSILGDMWPYLAAIGAFVASLVAAWFGGRKSQKAKQHADTIKRTERGREAVQRGRDSGGTPADRLRDNDGRWM